MITLKNRLITALASTLIVVIVLNVLDDIFLFFTGTSVQEIVQGVYYLPGISVLVFGIVTTLGTLISVVIGFFMKRMKDGQKRKILSHSLHAVAGVLIGVPLYRTDGILASILFAISACIYGIVYSLVVSSQDRWSKIMTIVSLCAVALIGFGCTNGYF